MKEPFQHFQEHAGETIQGASTHGLKLQMLEDGGQHPNKKCIKGNFSKTAKMVIKGNTQTKN
jgi:hypothetical protein